MGVITIKKKCHYCGTFDSDFRAAVAVNNKCRELGILLKNPEVEGPEAEVTIDTFVSGNI